MKRILSGVQPTGNLHLGNYLGAIRNWVKMQGEYECLFMLADLHAITVPQEPDKLRQSVRETAAAYIACGVYPEKSAIFHQSEVSAHAELSWILSCHTPMGWLNRMTQFKEKAQQSIEGVDKLIKETKNFLKELSLEIVELESAIGRYIENTKEYVEADRKTFEPLSPNFMELMELKQNLKNVLLEKEEALQQLTKIFLTMISKSKDILTILIEEASSDLKNSSKANLGLYSYPVLMAADILVYKATHVPVGEDQKQHLELTRDIAGAFNRHYKQDFFTLPEPVIVGGATRVMSLRDGSKKMSKSDESDYSRINLTDDADMIAKKIKKATSDSYATIGESIESRPEANNLLTIYAALKGISREQALQECGGMNFSGFKSALADVAVAHLAPIAGRMRELLAQPDYIDSILARGVEKARSIAGETMREVKDIAGFLRLSH